VAGGHGRHDLSSACCWVSSQAVQSVCGSSGKRWQPTSLRGWRGRWKWRMSTATPESRQAPNFPTLPSVDPRSPRPGRDGPRPKPPAPARRRSSKPTRAPLRQQGCPPDGTPHAVSNTKDVPMYTIAFHPGALPALLAGQSLSQVPSPAAAQPSPGSTLFTLATATAKVAVQFAYRYGSWR
jgi:hypothetical protein